MKIHRNFAIFLTLLLQCSPGLANEAGLNIIEYVDQNDPHRAELKSCAMPGYEGRTPEQRVLDCDVVLSAPSTEQSRHRFFYYRSSARASVGDFMGAVSDADAAFDPNALNFKLSSGKVLNQRCWTRALANAEIEEARRFCLEAIDMSGLAPYIIDSMGLVALRQGEWNQAMAAYSLISPPENSAQAAAVGRNPSPHFARRTYGKLLAAAGIRNSAICKPGPCQEGMDEQIVDLTKTLSAQEFDDAGAYYEQISLTPAGVKKSAEQAARSAR